MSAVNIERPDNVVCLVGVLGRGDTSGFYRLHVQTRSGRWFSVQSSVQPSRRDPLKWKAHLEDLGQQTAEHVSGSVDDVLSHPAAGRRHLHAAIGEVLQQLRINRGAA